MHADQLNRVVTREIQRALGFEAAQAARGGTPPQTPGSAFGLWGGWSGSTGLADLLNGQGPARLDVRGANLYRMSLPGTGVSIGMTVSNSIRQRVTEHATSARGEARVRAIINNVPAAQRNTIRIQAGTLRGAPSIREAHMYEIWLQASEHVFDWPIIRNTRTFD